MKTVNEIWRNRYANFVNRATRELRDELATPTDESPEPLLSRSKIIQRATIRTTEAALDVWDKLPASIAPEVMESVLELLTDELELSRIGTQ